MFGSRQTESRSSYADLIIGVAILALISLAIAWATHKPHGISGTGAISLSYAKLPLDAAYSWSRMAIAYLISLAFTMVYAYSAAYNPRAEKILIPLLDILQSVPILSFLPVVLLAFINLFPGSHLGVNLASIVLIFTGQVWNMVFALYNGLITIPRDLRETALSLQLTPWQRFRTLELPFAMGGLVWNSMMSWAGGWFFLMAAEMFSLGHHQYQLQGLGSYLQTAANQGRWGKEFLGLASLVAVIVVMDQLIWRPLLAWSDKFKMEMVEGEAQFHSVVLVVLRRSRLIEWAQTALLLPMVEAIDHFFGIGIPRWRRQSRWLTSAAGLVRTLVTAGIIFALFTALEGGIRLAASLNLHTLLVICLATGATLLRVLVSLAISVAWTVPVGVWIGLNPRFAKSLTPISQIAASVPATALFPGLVALLFVLGGGLMLASVLLMVLGTQWYILFNVIAGASAIPEDLKEAARMFGLKGSHIWRTLILPAIFPYLITGLITAGGGAWNASIVAEYVSFRGHIYTTFGVGGLIAHDSNSGHFAALLVATSILSLTVVVINRMVWRPLYRQATERYSLS